MFALIIFSIVLYNIVNRKNRTDKAKSESSLKNKNNVNLKTIVSAT